MKKVLLLAAALAVLAACGDSSKPPAQDPSQPPPAESAAPATSATAAPSDGANSGGW